MTKIIRTYSELAKLDTFEDRFRYLKLPGLVGRETFGFDRYLNQSFYSSREWKQVRDEVILRDLGCDLGIEDHEIFDKILIHHMNPIDPKQILHRDNTILDPEFLITVSLRTHNAIHYSDESILLLKPIERQPGDTCPWK